MRLSVIPSLKYSVVESALAKGKTAMKLIAPPLFGLRLSQVKEARVPAATKMARLIKAPRLWHRNQAPRESIGVLRAIVIAPFAVADCCSPMPSGDSDCPSPAISRTLQTKR